MMGKHGCCSEEQGEEGEEGGGGGKEGSGTAPWLQWWRIHQKHKKRSCRVSSERPLVRGERRPGWGLRRR